MTSIPPSKLKRYVKILKKHGNLSFASPPRVLGEGVFAVVLQARYKSPKDGLTRQVALKIAKKHNADGGNGYVSLQQYLTPTYEGRLFSF